MDPVDRVNRLLDALPRTRFFSLGREVPAFRSCGIAGFHVGVVVTLATGAARGRSLAVLAALAAVCGASFFAYALARKRITGVEQLVLLEHVWFALACATGALLAFGEPPLGYLDAVASGLAFFLAAGRTGCILVGCCHGFPSALGIRYGPELVRDGFAAPWVGVRLFPVQVVEAVALVAIGVGTVLFTLLGEAGAALSFFLVGYAVIRFGLEGLRADERPHLLGISQSRWMAVAEVAVALALAERARAHPRALAVLGVALAAWLVRTAIASRSGLGARALAAGHLAALRGAAASAPPPPRAASRSPLGFAVAASRSPRGRLVSLSGPGTHLDLPLLCRVATGAFPGLEPATAVLGESGVLFFEVPAIPPAAAQARRDLWVRLFAEVARARQEGRQAPALDEATPAEPGATAELPAPRSIPADPAARARYFEPVREGALGPGDGA